MELEQRVKALEYDMKILKNEVQRTLLDIHEQVLIHYYPALRSEESAPPEGVIQALEGVRKKQANRENVAAAEPAPSALAAAPLASSGPAAPSVPAVKRVTLDQIRESHVETPAAPKRVDAVSGLVKLVEWAAVSAARIGSERTIKLAQVCKRKGILTQETQELVVHIASINRETPPEQTSVNDMLDQLLKLDKTLGRPADPEGALSLIEEAELG